MKIPLLIVCLLLLVSCGYSNYLNHLQHDEFERIIVQIRSTGIDKNDKMMERTAIGFRIKGGYVIGLTHATTSSFLEYIRTPFGIIPKKIKTTNRKYYVNEKEVEVVGSYEDIALFKTNDGPFIQFGDSSKLIRGTRIAIWGFSFSKAHNFKIGVVSIPLIRDEYNQTMKNLPFDVSGNTMMIDANINSGDSGSPVIAFYNGNLRIVGIVCAGMPQAQGMNLAFTSNFVKKALKEII